MVARQHLRDWIVLSGRRVRGVAVAAGTIMASSNSTTEAGGSSGSSIPSQVRGASRRLGAAVPVQIG